MVKCTWRGKFDPTLSHRTHIGLEPELIVLFVISETRKHSEVKEKVSSHQSQLSCRTSRKQEQ